MMASGWFWLCLLLSGWTSNYTGAAKITNFTIGAVLNDERHDTLFREAITASPVQNYSFPRINENDISFRN